MAPWRSMTTTGWHSLNAWIFTLTKHQLNIQIMKLQWTCICKHSGEEAFTHLMQVKLLRPKTEDKNLKTLVKSDKYENQLVEDINVRCKNGNLVIPKNLQRFEVNCITTTCNILGLPIWRKHQEIQFIAKVCNAQSEHTSKTVKNDKSTKDVKISMTSYLQNWWLPSHGIPFVSTLQVHTHSEENKV